VHTRFEHCEAFEESQDQQAYTSAQALAYWQRAGGLCESRQSSD
jgi:hypothetical protein